MKNILCTSICSVALHFVLGAACVAAEREDIPTLGSLDLVPAEQEILYSYEGQAAKAGTKPARFNAGVTMPTDYRPWWIRAQGNTLGNGSGNRHSLEELYVRTIRNSNQIRVFADLPLIRETGIQEAAGAFDTNTFVQARFDHKNDPVGNTLTTGGASRFKQDEWSLEAGLRKKVVTGAEVTLSQQLSRTDNNSIYFVPNPQSRATLALSVTQPLLKGAGIAYNRAVMHIARLDSDIAMAEFVRQSESHLLEVARTYWALYAARVTYLQKQKLVDETARVTDELRARQAVDAQQTQLFRAQSALADRRAALVRSEAAVRNSQDRLRALINDASLFGGPNSEIIPTDRMVLSSAPVNMRHAAEVALQNRPEVTQAFLQLRAATVRESMTKKELLPELNLVLQGSLGGLDDGDYGGAYTRQYGEGGPGYGVGIVFSYPLENQIARARHERRQIETRQQINQLKTTLDTVLLEVKISAREVATSHREASAKYAAVEAYAADLDNLAARRALQTTADAAQTSDYLDTLLDAQDRRSRAEEDFIKSAANYQVAIANLERAKGRLLAVESIGVYRTTTDRNLPLLYLDKGLDKNPRSFK